MKSIMETLSEVNEVVALTDRVYKLKEEQRSSKPYIDVERSRLFTESYKQTEGEPLHIRRALAHKKVLEEIPVVIRDGEVIIGATTKGLRGIAPAIDWDANFAYGLLKGDSVSSGRITEEDKAILLECADYWKGKTPADYIYKSQSEVFGQRIIDMEKIKLCIGPGSRPSSGGRTSDYQKIIDKGLKSVINEIKVELKKVTSFSDQNDLEKYNLLKAMLISCEATINFAHRYARQAREAAKEAPDEDRRKELEKIAGMCEHVPANPARNFHEALQSFWLTHMAIILEASYIGEPPGRMDQYLYPYYIKDLEEGRLTRQEAAELLGFVWVKLNELQCTKGDVWDEAGQGNNAQNVTLGGTTADGKDASNELTYLILEVTKQLKTRQPQIYLRCHKLTPEELLMKALEVNRDRGDGQPPFLNDEVILLNWSAKGVPVEAARDWIGVGCIHPQPNNSCPCERNYYINLAKLLELSLNNGVDPKTGMLMGPATGNPSDFKTFEEMFEAFKKQVDYFVDLFAKSWRLFWHVRNRHYSLPFSSALMNDCIKKGLTHAGGGARFPEFYYALRDRGQQDVADSLAAVKNVVFEEGKATLDEVLQAMKDNFKGHEQLKGLLRGAPKYGNDDDYVDDIFNEVSLFVQRRINQEKHVLGQNFSSGRDGATVHIAFGKTVGALPNGREDGRPLADATLSPAQGVDFKGPTAVINSATKVNHTESARNSLLNMKISPNILKSTEGLQKLLSLVKVHFNRGAYHIQFNIIGQDVLLEAKKNPEAHRDLLVRVAGYSAYFVELSPVIQDEIISRTEHVL